VSVSSALLSDLAAFDDVMLCYVNQEFLTWLKQPELLRSPRKQDVNKIIGIASYGALGHVTPPPQLPTV